VRLSPRCPERPREGGLAAGVGAGGWIYAVENWTVGDNFGSSSTAVSRVSRLARTTNERHPRAPTSERVGLWVLPGCGEHTETARLLGALGWAATRTWSGGVPGEAERRRAQSGLVGGESERREGQAITRRLLRRRESQSQNQNHALRGSGASRQASGPSESTD
jgi:hypothetical protein